MAVFGFRALSMVVLCLSLLGAGHGAGAATVRFDVTFSTGGSGVILIEETLVAPHATVELTESDVLFNVADTWFDRPLLGSGAAYVFNAAGTGIVTLSAPGPARFVTFFEASGGSGSLRLAEGTVPGNFETQSVSSGNVSGGYTIAEGVWPAPVPVPASGLGLMVMLLGLYVLMRLSGRKARPLPAVVRCP